MSPISCRPLSPNFTDLALLNFYQLFNSNHLDSRTTSTSTSISSDISTTTPTLIISTETTTPNSSNHAMSPKAITGLAITCSIFFCVALASIFRLCSPFSTKRADVRSSLKTDNSSSGIAHLMIPEHPSQLQRMAEVRRIHNMELWERVMVARRELIVQGARFVGRVDMELLESLGGMDPNRQVRGRPSFVASEMPGLVEMASSSYLLLLHMNPYANPESRHSKMLTVKRVRHQAQINDSDDDFDVDDGHWGGQGIKLGHMEHGMRGRPVNAEHMQGNASKGTSSVRDGGQGGSRSVSVTSCTSHPILDNWYAGKTGGTISSTHRSTPAEHETCSDKRAMFTNHISGFDQGESGELRDCGS